MASKDSSDDEIPSLNSVPPPDEGGVEEVTRVGSHAEIQRALEEAKPLSGVGGGVGVKAAPKPSENIKTPTVPLPAVEIDTIARVDDAAGKKKKSAVEELEESALADAAPSTRPPAPPLPAGARKPSKAPMTGASAGSLPPAALVTAPAKSNLRIIVAVAIALVVVALVLASR